MITDHPFTRYQLRRRLGKGGMGVVYRAWDSVDEREVAVKIGEVPSDEAAAARLMREIRHASSVRDEHVCGVLGTGRLDTGAIFLAMELVSGPTLLDLAKKTRSGPSLWIEAMRALLLGLAAVHEQGITHRDVKPQNVMFNDGGVLKLLDFGIARSVQDDTVTATGQVIGTPAYMSPEQARAETTDARSDIFSAALTIANLAGRGTTRFTSTSMTMAQKVMRAAYWAPPLLMEFDPSTPPELEDVFARALTLQPENRAKNARELIAAIDACPIRHPLGEQWLRDWALGRVSPEAARAFDAARELERARALPKDKEAQPARALAWRRASLLDPTPGSIDALKKEVDDGGFRFDDDFDEPRQKLLTQMEQRPPNADELRRAAELFRRSGHLEVSVRLLWTYVRVRPDDVAAARQLDRLLFGPAANPSLSIAKGIRTGGLAASARRSLSDQETLEVVDPSAALAPDPTTNARPGRGGTSAARPPASSRARSVADQPGLPRWLAPLLLGLGAVVVTWVLIVTVRAARQEFGTKDKQIVNTEVTTVVDTRLSLVDGAEAALAAADHTGAIDKATRALGLDPFVETGRRALLVRAKAYIALGNRAAARRDLELYVERTTSFSDPNLAAVKKLLASLDTPDLGRPRE